MKKVNILNLVVTLGIGGAEILLTQYIKALGNEKYNHFVYCFGQSGPVKERIEELGIKVCIGKKRAFIKNPIRFLISMILLVADILRYMNQNRIDIIISHLSHANQLAALISIITRKPAFLTIHSTMEFMDARRIYDPRRILKNVVDEIVFRTAQNVLVVSNEIKEIVKDKFKINDEKIVIVNNGIVFSKTLFIKNPKGTNCKRKRKTEILVVARLVDIKGIDVIIKATYEAKKMGLNNFELNIVGDGIERKKLEKLTKKLALESQVKFLGIKKDVVKIMQNSDLLIIASKFEGLSLTMIEAMACGLPIISSNAPGLNTYIKHEKNGLLFTTGDPIELRDAILRIVSEERLRIRLSKEGIKYFKKNFDMKKNINELEKRINKNLECSLM